jgi:hypothetical protein
VGHSVVAYRFPTFLCAFVHFLRHFHDPIISNQRKEETKDKKPMRKRIQRNKRNPLFLLCLPILVSEQLDNTWKQAGYICSRVSNFQGYSGPLLNTEMSEQTFVLYLKFNAELFDQIFQSSYHLSTSNRTSSPCPSQHKLLCTNIYYSYTVGLQL